MKKVLIVGSSSFKDTSLLDEDYYKVAVDGGYRYFYDKKSSCDLLVGDFDTNSIEDLTYAKEVIRLNPNKDDTDTFYVVKKLLVEGYDDFVFLGCLDGRFDMSLSSISILYYLLKRKVKALLKSDDEEVFLIDREYVFKDVKNERISFISLTEKSYVKLTNFEYEYEGYFYLDTPLGVSNSFVYKESKIEVKEGVIIAIKSILK